MLIDRLRASQMLDVSPGLLFWTVTGWLGDYRWDDLARGLAAAREAGWFRVAGKAR